MAFFFDCTRTKKQGFYHDRPKQWQTSTKNIHKKPIFVLSVLNFMFQSKRLTVLCGKDRHATNSPAHANLKWHGKEKNPATGAFITI